MTIQENQLTTPYTVGEKSKLSGIEASAQVNAAIADQTVAEAGLDNAQTMTALRVAQAIAAQVGTGGGETNTASNEGGGVEVFLQKTLSNLEFRTFTAGSGMTINQNANTIEFVANAGGLTDTDGLAEGSTNLYYTEARVNANTSVAANSAKVSADGSIATHSDVTLTSPSNGQVLTYNGSAWVNQAATGGGSPVAVEDEGGSIETALTTLNFIGAGVTAVQNGAGQVDVTIPGGGSGTLSGLTDTTIASPSNGQVLTYNGASWINSAATGGSGGTTAFITIPAAGSLSARIAGATGLPAGWSIVLGNDGSVNAGLTNVGANSSDIVIVTGEGKSPGRIKVMKDFGGLVRQQVTYDPATGDILESNDYNQILLKDPENGTKAGTAQFEIVVLMPA